MNISPKTAILQGNLVAAKKRRRLRSLPLVVALALASGAPAAATNNLPDLGMGGAQDRELAELGREAIISASRRNATLDDVELHTYLSGLMQTLSGANALDQLPIELTIFADRSVNAFALPGGYIGVFAGLVLTAPSESALVSVMAHELAHLSQRHIHRFMQRQSQASLAAMAAMIAAALVMRDNPDAAQATIYSGLATANQRLLDYSRAHEREADRSGQRLMAAAGFRPQGMAEMFESLALKEQLNQGQGLEYLQTHPVTQSRIADAWEGARALRESGDDDAQSFALIQARFAALVGAPVTGPTRPYALALQALREDDPARAASALTKLEPELADHRTAQLLRARVQAAAGDLEAALERLTQLGRDYPGWYPAAHTRAELLSDSGDGQAAADTLAGFLRQHDSHWPQRYRQLSIYYDQADDEINALRWRGEYYAEARNYLAAAGLFDQALKLAEADSAIALRLQSRLKQMQERALQERPSEVYRRP